jgi:hypothetical protein
MARHKMVNGVRIQFTPEEETARDAEEAAWEAGKFDRAIAGLREDRTRRLSSTDWYALQDVTLSPEMRTYRQALRDLTAGLSTVEGVENISWPVKPAG